jgi:hypothetical protein
MIAMHRPNVKASKGVNLAARYITAKISGIAPHDPNDPKMDKNLKHIRLAERIIAGSIAAGSALASIWSGLAYFL